MRTRFIDAAEDLLREEGFMAISARQVASKAGLKNQLLYYYFRTMDDLIVAVLRRVNERRMERFHQALAAPEPLRALWEMNCDPSGAALAAEFTSIAQHREAIRAEIVSSAQHFRGLQIEAVSRLMGAHDAAGSPAAGIIMLAGALGRAIVTEQALGFSDGHAEALAMVDRAIAYFSAPPPKSS